MQAASRRIEVENTDLELIEPPGGSITLPAWSYYRDAGGEVTEQLGPSELTAALGSGTGTLWVDIDAQRTESTRLLSELFHFHPLAVEDSLNPESRVKLEEYSGFLILVVRTVAFRQETADPYDIHTVNLACFLGRNYLVTVHHGRSMAVEQIRNVLAKKPELAAIGPARVMHAVVDETVNAYFPIIDQLDEFMDGLEERIFSSFDQEALHDIFAVKRLVLSIRRHLAPERDVFTILTNRPSTLMSPDTQLYFRDIYDHVLRINDALETYRDLLASTMESYLTQVSNRLGSITKALSVVATLSVPFVVVSGMWGMNFTRIPMADHPYGFWIMLVVQLGLGSLLLLLLRGRRLI